MVKSALISEIFHYFFIGCVQSSYLLIFSIGEYQTPRVRKCSQANDCAGKRKQRQNLRICERGSEFVAKDARGGALCKFCDLLCLSVQCQIWSPTSTQDSTAKPLSLSFKHSMTSSNKHDFNQFESYKNNQLNNSCTLLPWGRGSCKFGYPVSIVCGEYIYLGGSVGLTPSAAFRRWCQFRRFVI